MGRIKKGKWKPKGIRVEALQGQHWWALHGGEGALPGGTTLVGTTRGGGSTG